VGFAGGEFDGLDAGGLAGGDVAPLVADEPGLIEVEIHVLGGAENEARFGLAAIAFDGQFRPRGLGGVGQVRTGVIGIDAGAQEVELIVEGLVKAMEVVLGETAARDGGLIGDDDELVSGGGEAREGAGDAAEDADLFGAAGVSHVLDKSAIAIEKHGRSAHG
jgi:hypothetical protein